MSIIKVNSLEKPTNTITGNIRTIQYSITIDNQTFNFHSLREFQRMLKRKGLIKRIDYTT